VAGDERAAELAVNRELWRVVHERVEQEAAAGAWVADELTWGLFGVPDSTVGALRELAGLDVLELGCGTAHLSARLARRGARPVALDLTGAQLRTAQLWQDRIGPRFPLVEADAEHLPLAAAAFDLVVSEHGAAAWCDPERWLPEAARVLRPGGRLVFLTNSLLSALCVPDEPGFAGDRLLRGQRAAYRVHWDGGGFEYHPSHGGWVAALRRAGFAVEALHELYAPPGSADHDHYEIVTAEWAARWPAEELWVAHLGPA